MKTRRHITYYGFPIEGDL